MLQCSQDFDMRLIPDSPASEQDTLEIRIQCSNAAAPVKVKFFCGEDFWGECTAKSSGVWQVASFRHPLNGLSGNQVIKAELSDGISSVCAVRHLQVVKAHPAIFQGGFVMLGAPADRKPCAPFRDAIMDLDDDAWVRQVDGWNTLGMKTLVLYDTIFPADLREKKYQAYYRSAILPQAPVKAVDPIAAILAAAEKNGQQIFMGMCAWQGASDELQQELLCELYERYRKYKSFYGWYASSEFSTAGFSFDNAAMYFSMIRSRIGQFSPVMPLLTSPYQVSLHLDADHNTSFTSPEFAEIQHYGVHPHFGKLLAECTDRPDIIMPQDGAGRRYPYPRHPDLIEFNFRSFASLKEVADAAGVHLWGNVESFDFSDDDHLVPRFANGGFDGEKGLVQQLESVYSKAEKVLTFSLPGFFAPENVEPAVGGAAAREQADKYQKYLSSPRKAYKNLAGGCSYVITPNPCKLLPDRTPQKLTDGLVSGGYAVDIDSDRLIGFISSDADEKGDLTVEIILDLNAVQEFHQVRLAGSVRRIRGRADSMRVEYSESLEEPFKLLGTTEKYRLGYMLVESDSPIVGRFIRITLRKHFHSDIKWSWRDSWLLLDELEVLQQLQ